MVTMAQADANRAALARGEWVAGGPYQARAQVPVKAPGGVPVRVVKTVWRGRMYRRDPDTGRPEQDFCPHNHLKRGAAEQCGQRAVRRRNREAATRQPGETRG
jgi:hypothetical protein